MVGAVCPLGSVSAHRDLLGWEDWLLWYQVMFQWLSDMIEWFSNLFNWTNPDTSRMVCYLNHMQSNNERLAVQIFGVLVCTTLYSCYFPFQYLLLVSLVLVRALVLTWSAGCWCLHLNVLHRSCTTCIVDGVRCCALLGASSCVQRFASAARQGCIVVEPSRVNILFSFL